MRPVQQEANILTPRRGQLTYMQALQRQEDVRRGSYGAANVVEVGEGQPREGHCRYGPLILRSDLGVNAERRIRRGVEAPPAILHGEIEAEEFVDPLVLGHHSEALI